MANKPHPIVAGNWKMNGLSASLSEIEAMAQGYEASLKSSVNLLICPPATLVAAAIVTAAGRLSIGGQDCHQKESGAHTGDVSASMLADLGATFVIVGHSERRSGHAESSALVKAKAEAALAAGLIAIVCVGETDAERKTGRTLEVVGAQVAGSLPAGATAANLVLAYEPVWAIGTGLTPTAADVAEVHAFIRAELARALGAEGAGVRILYGGSVKPSNALELMSVANVDGALVGGASLTAKDLLGIAAAYR